MTKYGYIITGRNRRAVRDSDTSTISTSSMRSILDRIKSNCNKDTTSKIYHNIWTNFNRFLIRLDRMPDTWEEKTSLYCAYLVNKGIKSSTMRSYVSAIKHFLITDEYPWDDNKILLSAITRSCRLVNDTVYNRLPIQIGLLELILVNLPRIFESPQPYLEIMYRTFFCTVLLRLDASRGAC